MSEVAIRHDERQEVASVAGDCVRIGDATFTVEHVGHGLYRVTGDAGQHSVAVAGPPERPWVFANGVAAQLEIETSGRTRGSRTGTHDLSSPMPATVIRVAVEPGAAVGKGETLVVLEAMKMELPIRAPSDGVVTAVHCKAGDLVQPGVPLLDFA